LSLVQSSKFKVKSYELSVSFNFELLTLNFELR